MKDKIYSYKESSQKRFSQWRYKAAALVFYDIFSVALSFFIALWVLYDCKFHVIPEKYLESYIKFIGVYVIFSILIFWRFRLYNCIWKSAGFSEVLKIVAATAITFLFHVVFITLIFDPMPVAYYFLGIAIQFVAILSARFSSRMWAYFKNYVRYFGRRFSSGSKNILLIGAGDAGQLILSDIHKSPEIKDTVKCIIDDDPNKWGRFMEGVPIVGGRDKIVKCVEKYRIDKIFLVIPSVSYEEKRKILEICKSVKCELKELPGIYQLYSGEITVAKMKDVPVEDLLGRNPVKVDMKQIFEYLSGKIILVTGAGGSIGSELSAQIAAHNPKLLVLLDFYENNLYDIQFKLKSKFPSLKFETVIGSVRDSRKLAEVFGHYRPEIVFHAAAHKHVPLMEDSPCEAIKNNALGTYKTAYAAALYGCKRFVLISTDKAVNPTNIMGASKRLCEMIIQSFDKKIKDKKTSEIPALFTHSFEDESEKSSIIPNTATTEFVAVRFGNVLGSNGSVIPLFKKQIEMGGPVTVTHPDIVRYFMTIPEAVSLVLQAATYAHGGEIFVLDMGEPVKIDTLARNLISMSGYRPDVDIKVVYTGLRPGEKLYEEKLMAEEGLQKTPNELIHIGKPIPFDCDEFLKELEKLMQAAYDNREDIRERVAKVVTTYRFNDAETSETDVSIDRADSIERTDELAATSGNIKDYVSVNGLKEAK